MYQRRALAKTMRLKEPDCLFDACCTWFCGCCTLAQDARAVKKYAEQVGAPVQAQVQQPWNMGYNHGDQNYDPYGNGYYEEGPQPQQKSW